MTDLSSRFAGRTALVVGGSNGIGRASVERLEAEGARVIVADLEADGSNGVRLDVTDAASVADAADRIADLAPDLDTVVHAAGGAVPHGGFEDIGDDVWTRMFELNALGNVRVARALIPLLRAGSGDRSFVFVTSVNGIHILGEQPYSIAKAALIALTRHLAAEFAPHRIRVNAVAPGTVRTRVWEGQTGGADRMRPLYPLGRVGEPADIAAAIAFLASEDASWITGQILAVDGGLDIAVPEHIRRAIDEDRIAD